MRNAPSQPAGPPVTPPSPSYPFEMIAIDYFHLDGWNYLVIGDRFSGWISIHRTGRGDYDADKLVESLKTHFLTFGVAAECASDMGPQMKSVKFEKFLKQYGVHHRQSSSYFPHSNMRAELAVKSGKRLLRDNVGPSGELGTDKFLRAMMQYRNTPNPETRLSPAQVVFGRQIKDFLPVLGHKYEPKQEWGLVQEARDRVMAKRLERDGARLEMYTKKQKVIPVGDSVAVQNQTGRFPTKWDKTGTVVENLDHDKVRVRLDGSRRLTVRNRRFVKKIVSPCDLPINEEINDTLSSDKIGQNGGPIYDGMVRHQIDSPHLIEQQPQVNNDQHGAVLDIEGPVVDVAYHGDDDTDVGEQLPSHVSDDDGGTSQLPIIDRPRRQRRLNVKYSDQEYDLSAVAAPKNRIQLLGLYIAKKGPNI